MRYPGKVTAWNDDRGFGFITPRKGGDRIFFHIKAFQNHDQRPEINRWVTYELAADPQGRPQAVKVLPAGKTLRRQSVKLSGTGFVFLFFAALAGLVAFERLPVFVLAIYGVLSVVTFVAYAKDKSAARQGNWRTPEGTLQLLALAGGWPGALVAQQKLRHKTRKVSFQSVFWVTVVLNCIVLIWILSPYGAAELESFLASWR